MLTECLTVMLNKDFRGWEYILIFIVPGILTETCHSVLQLQCFLLLRILAVVHGHGTQFEEKQLQLTLDSIRLTGFLIPCKFTYIFYLADI